MIDDLDRTLEELLARTLPPSLVRQVSISFDAPDDQFPPSRISLPAIDLFLYDVRENRELRSNEWKVGRENGTVVRRRAPTRIDCSYLITAWSSQTSTNPARDEHRLLSEVMKTLLRFPTLPAAVLQGELAAQEPPLPTSVLHPGRLQSIAEFWQALGGTPKAVLSYTVTIGVEVDGEDVLGPPVTDMRFRFSPNLLEG
jgi:hypothetical protein